MNTKPKSARVRKSDGVELYALTVRLPPKVKLGLELLARMQGRALSQAVDWALQYTLANIHANEDLPEFESKTLAELVEAAENHAEWERAYWLYVANPVLVKFEERHACRILLASEERSFLDEKIAQSSDDDPRGDEVLAELFECWRLIAAHVWPNLLRDSDELVLAPSVTASGLSLTEIYYAETRGSEIEERMRIAAKIAKVNGVTVPSLPDAAKTWSVVGGRARPISKLSE